MKALEITMPLAIASYDIDYGGVVSNIVYVRWLEDLRHALIQELYPFQRQIKERIAPAVVEVHLRYQRALRFLDQAEGRMRLDSVQGVRLHFEAEILLEGKTAMSAQQTCAFINLDTGRPTRVPQEIIRMIESLE